MSEDVLDLKEFLERVQDDKELLLELLDIFVGDYEIKRKQLTDAVSRNDGETVRSIAHSLKGASGNISAKLLRQTCTQLEQIGKGNDLSVAEKLLNTMDSQYEALKGRIADVKKELQ